MKTRLGFPARVAIKTRLTSVLALLGAGLASLTLGQTVTPGPVPELIDVDARNVAGSNSNANGVLEPGETVQVAPWWKNILTTPQTFTGTASNFTGPAALTFTLNDSSENCGTVNPGATADCNSASGDCYLMTVSGTRPATHWDARFTEDLSINSISQAWTLHIGESFGDVPISNPYYRFIETLFHNRVTAGCDTFGNYCPDDPVTRAQMAVFLLASKFGADHVPPKATGTVFNDVHASDFAADWIEELASLGITEGCGDGNYCPNKLVTRAEMAVLLLVSEHGSGWAPPPCAGLFADVECSPTPAFAVNWIEQLYNEGVTGGCFTNPLIDCPGDPVTRGQMAVFLVQTFGLRLAGPRPPPQTLTVTLNTRLASTCSIYLKYFFSPTPIRIRAGDTITWTWSGGTHSTSGGEWDSGVHAGPYTFSHTFTEPGTFPYHCSEGHKVWFSVICGFKYCCVPGFAHEGGVVIVDP